MNASWTAYMSWDKGKRQPLRFSKSGDPNLERAYATHYLLPREREDCDLAAPQCLCGAPDSY